MLSLYGWETDGGRKKEKVAVRTLFAVLLALSLPPWPAAADDAWTDAIAKRDIQAVERMIAREADVNRATADGRTALMLAAAERHPALMRALLERGADANAANDRGGTALMYSAAAGDLESVELLLARGARVNASAANGWTALTLASVRGFDEIVAVLLARGADPTAADIYEWTPLMRAVQQNRARVVRALLASKRTDVDARDENGHTALHHAAAQGLTDIVRLLIARGANVGILDRAGRTPAAVAAIQGHHAAAEIIGRAADK